jgi:hypothetical protein
MSSRLPSIVWLLLSASGFLSACAAPGPSYDDVMAGAQPLAEDTVRLVFLRPRDRDDGVGDRGAVIRVNGRGAGAVRYGGFFFMDMAPGRISLAASGPYTAFGGCEIEIDAASGTTIYVDVGPRLSYMVAGAVGSVLGGATAAAVMPDVYGSAGEAVAVIGAGGAAGSAAGTAAATGAESRDRACGGPYRLTPISEESARTRLGGLVWSR